MTCAFAKQAAISHLNGGFLFALMVLRDFFASNT
jgi:hypothetical protein